MKTLLKFAMGAAIAGALVNMLMKQRSGKQTSTSGESEASYDPNAQNAGSKPGTFALQDLIAEPVGDLAVPQVRDGGQL